MNRKMAAAIEFLRAGRDVVGYIEGGNSMTKIYKPGQPMTLRPIIDPSRLRRGDVVLVSVRGNTFTHLISAVSKNSVKISNCRGRVNGSTPFDKVHGIVTEIAGVKKRNSQY